MPRKPRAALGDLGIFHVFCRGNNKKRVFHDDTDFYRFDDIVRQAKEKFGMKIYYYAWMPNHYHLLIESETPGALSASMKTINQNYSNWHKDRYGGIGHLWQDRFKSKPIGSDFHFVACARYIEINPVKDGICRNPGDYRWSSYRFHALGSKNSLVDVDSRYLSMGKSEESRCSAHRLDVDFRLRIIGDCPLLPD